MAIKPEQTSGVLGLQGTLNEKVNPDTPDIGMWKLDSFYLDETSSLTKSNGFQRLNTVALSDVPFTGIFDFPLSDGTRRQIATGLTGVYRYDSPTPTIWNSLDLTNAGGARTGIATNLYDSIILNDMLYLGNGKDANIRYDGTSVWYDGIAASIIAPTATLGGTGITGAYMYKFTYQNSSLGHESNSSPTSITYNPANQTVTVTVKCTADAQVDKIRIYRTTNGGGVYLYVGSVANIVGTGTTTFADNYADATLGIAIDDTGNNVPPIFSMAEIWQGYAFMGGNPVYKSRIYFSKNNFPNAVDLNDFRDLDPNDGDILTGIHRAGPIIVAFKNNSIWNATGYDRNTFAFDKKVTAVGAVNNACIVEVPGKSVLCFLSPNAKFYFYNGDSESQTAIGLEPILKGLNQSQLAKTVGTVLESKNQCRWIVPNGVSTQCDLMIWFDYLQNKWGTRSISNVTANYCTTLKDSSSRTLFYTGGYTGFVWQGDTGGTDDGTAITCEVMDRGHPSVGGGQVPSVEMQRCFYQLFVWFKVTAGCTISVYAYIDDPTGTRILLGTIDASKPSGQHHLHFKKTGRRIYFDFVESSNIQGLVIRGWKTHYNELGRHNAA